MTDETKPEGTPQATPTNGQAQAHAAADAAAKPNSGEMSMAVAEAAINALQTEVAELKDRLLRSHAEMDNIRKRTDKEKTDAHKYAVTKFARDMIEVGDNFLRAIETVPAGAAEQDPALKSFLDGVTMTEREFTNRLERHGIKRIDPKGEPFNPHLHQAVTEVQNPEVPAGTVTQVYQLGYMIEDRVLRPAMVVVAKGGFKPMRPVETTPAGSANDNGAGGAGGQG